MTETLLFDFGKSKELYVVFFLFFYLHIFDITYKHVYYDYSAFLYI